MVGRIYHIGLTVSDLVQGLVIESFCSNMIYHISFVKQRKTDLAGLKQKDEICLIFKFTCCINLWQVFFCLTIPFI